MRTDLENNTSVHIKQNSFIARTEYTISESAAKITTVKTKQKNRCISNVTSMLLIDLHVRVSIIITRGKHLYDHIISLRG
jgi:hypothetical protein